MNKLLDNELVKYRSGQYIKMVADTSSCGLNVQNI